MSSAAIDIKMGEVIRGRRVALGLSQEAVAARMGLTFQQVQKYEKGHSSLNVSRLHEMARALEWNALALLSAVDSTESHSLPDTREALELIKRINLLEPHEADALRAFLNILCRGRK